jgi:hypothetical protein
MGYVRASLLNLTFEEWCAQDLGAMLATRPLWKDSHSNREMVTNMPRLILMDGEGLSVQASDLHYSTPRNLVGPYTNVEVGYPSSPPPSTWEQYADSPDTPCSTIYSYIPLHLVLLFIGAHGGINKQVTFRSFAHAY